jgi:hypothetical protein
MNLAELHSRLEAHPGLTLTIALPDGSRVPAHFHVTEVGHVAKKFVDCGGTFRASETCVLQVHVGSPRDDGHRLTAGRLAKILDLAQPVLPAHDLPVEIEFEAEVISQFPLASAQAHGAGLVLQLGHKHTDCLAKDRCGLSPDAEETGGCCAGAAAGGNCC